MNFLYVSCYVEWCLGISMVPCSCVVFCVCGWHLTKLNGLPHCASQQVTQTTGCSHGKWSQNNMSLPCHERHQVREFSEQESIRSLRVLDTNLGTAATSECFYISLVRKCWSPSEILKLPKAGGYRWWLGTCPDYWHLILGCFSLDAPAGSQSLLLDDSWKSAKGKL